MADREKQRKEWEEEIAGWPEPVRTVALKYPPLTCWRSTQSPEFHYIILDYAHNKTLGTVTLTLMHGSGTRMAGVATFGQPPEQLIMCDCGEWQQPTSEESAATHARMMGLAAQRKLEARYRN